MAHFAELELKTDPTGFTSDTHLVVKRVVVVGNDIEVNGGTLADNGYIKGNNLQHQYHKQSCRN